MFYGTELKHHSPSSVSSFLENRAQWYRNKIIGDKFSGSEHTARGTAVEAGINNWLTCSDTDSTIEAIKHALEIWHRETESFKDDPQFQLKELEFKQSIAPLVNAGIESVKERYLEVIDAYPVQQHKISLDIPGCKFPVLGYLDWYFPNKLVVDNKVSGKKPSKLKQGYIVQGSVYHMATGLPVEFHFEVANKTPTITTFRMSKEDIQYGWMLFCRAAKAIENIFANPLDGQLLQDIFLANPEAMFSEKDVKKALKDFEFVK